VRRRVGSRGCASGGWKGDVGELSLASEEPGRAYAFELVDRGRSSDDDGHALPDHSYDETDDPTLSDLARSGDELRESLSSKLHPSCKSAQRCGDGLSWTESARTRAWARAWEGRRKRLRSRHQGRKDVTSRGFGDGRSVVNERRRTAGGLSDSVEGDNELPLERREKRLDASADDRVELLEDGLVRLVDELGPGFDAEAGRGSGASGEVG
jgi:hypothetical protein